MSAGLSARMRAAIQHGAEGAERLRGQWARAGRQAYHDAIREGREVVARTESELEALGREALAKKRQVEGQAKAGVRAVQRRVDAGRAQVTEAVNDARQAARDGAATARRVAKDAIRSTGDVMAQMGGQITSAQPLEREIARSMASTGADAVGKVWNLPNTAIGLAYGGGGHLAGLARGTHPYVTVDDNAIQFRNNPFGGEGAITLGNTTTYDDDPSDPAGEWARYNRTHAAPITEHERQHTIQGQQLGPLYLPSNILGGLAALSLDRDDEGKPDWHGPHNWNERGPQETVPRPWSWSRR